MVIVPEEALQSVHCSPGDLKAPQFDDLPFTGSEVPLFPPKTSAFLPGKFAAVAVQTVCCVGVPQAVPPGTILFSCWAPPLVVNPQPLTVNQQPPIIKSHPLVVNHQPPIVDAQPMTS